MREDKRSAQLTHQVWTDDGDINTHSSLETLGKVCYIGRNSHDDKIKRMSMIQ